MKYQSLFFILLLFLLFNIKSKAQEFVTRAKIEFEKKYNMKRSLSNQNLSQGIMDRYPEFQTTYFDLSFAGNQTLYKAGRDNTPPSIGGRTIIVLGREDNALYTDFNSGKVTGKRSVMQEDIIFEDSIPPIKWKIGQETRMIAGYECRKAIGRIYDSVYLVAFYAEEIVIKGGPEGIQGLPGMILGLAIPRYNTTWFATKVELAKLDESTIVPPTLRGKKLSRDEAKAKLLKKMEQMGSKNITAASLDHYFKAGYFLDY